MANQESKIPTHRLARFGQFASLATRIGSNVVAEGAKQLLKGERPHTKDLLLTPSNIKRVADQLAHLRGAAMKVGQMLSMDSGDILSPELAEILARLRSDANPMLSKQLNAVLVDGLGENWKQAFLSFNFKPVASASIGQVHQAYTDDGDMVAVKVQYPGIRNSIDSDVDNVATLLNVVGVIPKDIDINALLGEAKKQLHAEANYQLECEYLQRYKQHLTQRDHFVIPKAYPELSSETVLTMEYVEGVSIESLVDAPQAQRDAVMHALLELLFAELFDFQLVQTDPNFANYRYNTQSQKVVLLDFGATREYSDIISNGYRLAFQAVINHDTGALEEALRQIGFFSQTIVESQKQAILELVTLACEPMCYEGAYDFGQSDLANKIRQRGTALSMQENYWHTPPIDAIFLHRKIGGLYLLAARLKARVDIRKLVMPYLSL
ncbi:ABC1 kinase family protein [Vibrio panuliri]|uniref:Ubiquinol-cytochrome C reductase n=1 Tax=Vibrio panuliri TaxID=1381081 RepID=A0ABX3F9D3_9VIBR|nr:AarF/ABC1/UbiB kinase family protein [Vibrio panuliri]KAB1457789.1 AarF/ABC1/UbiB kinase family protein [Vibrio panuliri]OLQ85728.1 ubiquinol-cytochrome C reductase [Vibrio panuliri]